MEITQTPQLDIDFAHARAALTRSLAGGLLKGGDGWTRQSTCTHAAIAAQHLERFLLGHSGEDHLALARLLLALELRERKRTGTR